MRTGRLFFAGAVFLGLAYYALRSPLPVADPRFIKEDFASAEAPISISVFLETGYLRDRGHTELAAAAATLRAGSDGAKALEDAAAQLKAAGIRNSMLKFGATLVTRGKHGNAPWRVGVRKPRGKGPDDVLAYLLEDRDEALSSYSEDEPGAPSSGLRSITVVAADAPKAAQGAKALFASGAELWPAAAERRGIAQALAVDADGAITVTKALGERLKFMPGQRLKTLP